MIFSIVGGPKPRSPLAVTVEVALTIITISSIVLGDVHAELNSRLKSRSLTFMKVRNKINDRQNPIHNYNNFELMGIPRGGSSIQTEKSPQEQKQADNNILQKYRISQQHLLQLRSTYLSEALSSRGIHVGPTLVDVATPEGSKPPQMVDWDCCLSTSSHPKSCLYSFDAEVDTKVIAPMNTNQWISLQALNRLRRTDPSKVEPMWHSQYAILNSWFKDQSQFSLLQFVGWKGFIVSTLLLDLGKGAFLRSILAVTVLSIILIALPLIECVVSRIMTSSLLWMKWMSWGRFVHAALPLKILLGQMAWKFCARSFGKLEAIVRDYVVELECHILEEHIPVTIVEGGEDDNNEDEDSSDSARDSDIIDTDFSEEEEYDEYDEDY